MIIKEVQSDKGFLFLKKPELKVVSNQAEGTTPFFVGYNTEELTSKLKDLEIVSAEDFSKISQRFSNPDLIRSLQLATFSAQLHPEEFFSKGIKQIPRPLHIVFEKQNGVQFLVFSLQATSFEKAVLANEEIAHILSKKVTVTQSEEEILEKLKETIKEVQLHFDFELRMGVNFARQLPLEKIQELIPKYNLLYAEDVSLKNEDYKTLTDKFKQTTFICKPVRSLQDVQEITSNAALLEFSLIENLYSLVKMLKEKNVNLFYSLKQGEEFVAVALAIPIVKISQKETEATKKLSEIKETLRTNK